MNLNQPLDVATALPEFGTPSTVEILALLIAQQMGLKPGVVQIYNQKRRLPPVDGFFVDVAILGDRPFAVNTRMVNDPATADLVEEQTINQQESIQIDIFSYDQSARTEKLGIIFALTGVAAQQLQERFAFKMGNIPASFTDASEVEGNARLNRYALAFNLLRAYSRTSPAQTFTVFQNPPQQLLTNP